MLGLAYTQMLILQIGFLQKCYLSKPMVEGLGRNPKVLYTSNTKHPGRVGATGMFRADSKLTVGLNGSEPVLKSSTICVTRVPALLQCLGGDDDGFVLLPHL